MAAAEVGRVCEEKARKGRRVGKTTVGGGVIASSDGFGAGAKRVCARECAALVGHVRKDNERKKGAAQRDENNREMTQLDEHSKALRMRHYQPNDALALRRYTFRREKMTVYAMVSQLHQRTARNEQQPPTLLADVRGAKTRQLCAM